MNELTIHGLAAAIAGAGALLAAASWNRARQAAPAGERAGADPALPLWRTLAHPLAQRLRPTGRDFDELAAALLKAGRSGRAELDRFLEEKAAATVAGAGAGLALGALAGGELGGLVLLLGVAAGLILPRRRLRTAAERRQDSVAAALPNAIDLLMTTVDAGLSIEQAVARVAVEIAESSPVLAQELSLTANECEAGVPLTEALRRLARRVELEELTGLCAVVAQAHELGAPIVKTLAEYADTARKMRMAMLEENAGKLVTKLALPLAMFLLPASLVAMLAPAAIQLIRVLN